MPRDGAATREKILDAAQALILERGYSGTTVDDILAAAGVTKGAFFYHFKSKSDLAAALLQRFNANDEQTFNDTRMRAEQLSNDPLQQVLIFIGLFEEMFTGLTEPYPGCLFASYVQELQQFDATTQTLIKDSFLGWRELLREKFDAIAKRYPPKIAIDSDDLADAFTVVFEGGFITSKALEEPDLVATQLRLYKRYIELLFGADERKSSSSRANAA
jgi:TetR/AcrR family transcriptional repressor of nem operon